MFQDMVIPVGSNKEVGIEDYLDTLNSADDYSMTFADLEVGKKYLLLIWNWSSSSNLNNDRFDGTTASGGTLTKITNLRIASGTARVAGTFFLLEPSSETVALTCSYKMQAHLIIPRCSCTCYS